MNEFVIGVVATLLVVFSLIVSCEFSFNKDWYTSWLLGCVAGIIATAATGYVIWG